MRTPSEEKWHLRKKFRATLPVEAAERSIRLCKILLHEIASMPHVRSVGFFAGMGSEPDLGHLFHSLATYQKSYPRVIGESMMFHQVTVLSDLVEGRWGISEPKENAEKCQSLDLVICPGVAFGKDGSRLGKGKGYYDSHLASLPKRPILWGVLFEEFLVERVPCEAHDIKMDRIFVASRSDATLVFP